MGVGLLTLRGPAAEGDGETKWVVSEKFFDELGTVLDTVPPPRGEETLYGHSQMLLDSAGRDDAIKTALVDTATATEVEVIVPFFEWTRNGRPAGNGWNRFTNNAQFGHDYYDRTGTANSNTFDNKPTGTQYFYTDNDRRERSSTATAITGLPSNPAKSPREWLLVDDAVQRRALLPPQRPQALLTRHQEQGPQPGRRRVVDALRRRATPGPENETNWLPAPAGPFSPLRPPGANNPSSTAPGSPQQSWPSSRRPVSLVVSLRHAPRRAHPRSRDQVLRQVPVQSRSADPQVLSDAPPGVCVGLHPRRGGDALGVVDLAGPPELGAVRGGGFPLERGALLAG